MSPLNIDVRTLIEQMGQTLQTLPIMHKAPKMIGIRTAGVWVAEKLHAQLQLPDALGVIDINFYRDDFSKVGLNPTVMPSDIPWEVEDQHIILVDDILYTGRTIRAALNEIFDYGRPASVTLVVLLDRKGCRELPFQAEVVGLSIECYKTLKLCGPDPLSVSLTDPEEDAV